MSGFDEVNGSSGDAEELTAQEREVTAQERRVRDLLRGSADVGPMPDDVVARIDAALTAAQPRTEVTSLAGHRRRSRLPRLVAAAAGIAVLGGGVWFATLDRPDGASSAASGAAATAEEVPSTARVLLSGKDYADAAAVKDLAEDTLDGTASEAAGSQAQDSAAPQDAPAGGGAEATPGADSLADGGITMLKSEQESATSDPSQLPTAERALACTKQLGVDPGSVLAVEIATWRTAPAALVVHRTDDGAEVVVVATDCEPGDGALSRVDVPDAT